MEAETLKWPCDPAGLPVEAVPVLTGISQMDADIKATLLGAFGVPVRVERSALNDRYTPVVFGSYLMFADLLVPKGCEEEAAALLASEGDADEEGVAE